MSIFSTDIKVFNGMYKLPVSEVPTLENVGDPIKRLQAFKDILSEELNEIDEIILALEKRKAAWCGSLTDEEIEKLPKMADILTMLADLLGDIQVYCASEMTKFGLPVDEVLRIIMQSNFSKLGSDGKPIYDERGKVQKGPGYWKPEPMLKKALELIIENSEQITDECDFEEEKKSAPDEV